MMIRSEIFMYLLTSTIYSFADDYATKLLLDAEMLPTDEGGEEKRNESCIKEDLTLKIGIGSVVDVQANLSHLSADRPKGVINETLVKIDDTSGSSNRDNKDDKKVKLKEKNPKLIKHPRVIVKEESSRGNGSYANTTMTNSVRKSNNYNSCNGGLSQRQTETNSEGVTTNPKKLMKGKDISAKMDSVYNTKEKKTTMKVKESKERENKREAITRRLRMLRMFLFK